MHQTHSTREKRSLLSSPRLFFSPRVSAQCKQLWFGSLAFAFCLLVPAIGGNWPQFRGPNASGLDTTRPLATNWNVEKGEHILWQTPVPGLGHASPVIWGDQVYVATAVKPGQSELKTGLYGDIEPIEEKEPHQWRLLALSKASGKIVWNTLAHESLPSVKRHPKASHCNSTPAADGKHIVAMFGSEGLFCFDTNGKLEWKKDLGPLDSGFFAVPSAQWGFGCSPIIHEGKIITLCDVQTNSFIAAFAIADGKELWRTARKDVPTWGTPTIVEAAARKQIAVNGWHQTAGYDLLSGKELWRLDGGGDIPVPTPVFANDLIYFTSAHGKFRPLRAVHPGASGDITPSDPGQTNQAIAWAHARQGNYMQTPIVIGDLLFACFDIGLVTCMDAKNGSIKYSERLGSGSSGFTASPVSDGHHIYFANEPGNVFVVPAADTFSVIATNALGESCMATPAISDGTLFFRTRSKLIAIAEDKSSPKN